MADFTAGPEGAGVSIPAGKYVNIAAAAVSVALIGGVGIWGYKLLVRDVTGVPVVKAIVGEMRVAPENPGGEIASNIGLSVNAVPALGGAAEPEDRLILAPSSVALAQEDMDMVPTAAVASVPAPETNEVDAVAVALSEVATNETSGTIAAIDPATPLTAGDVLALADQVAAEATPLSELSEGENVPVEIAVNGVPVNPDIIADSVPGVRQSPRPSVRPAGLRTVAAVVASAVSETQATPAAQTATVQEPAPAAEVAPAADVVTAAAAVPAGTSLVQLGAFDGADIAASEWVRLTGNFPEFFDGKERVIQETTSSGRTFFRLRALGFEDSGDANRFCAAMTAEGAACIPVLVR